MTYNDDDVCPEIGLNYSLLTKEAWHFLFSQKRSSMLKCKEKISRYVKEKIKGIPEPELFVKHHSFTNCFDDLIHSSDAASHYYAVAFFSITLSCPQVAHTHESRRSSYIERQ